MVWRGNYFGRELLGGSKDLYFSVSSACNPMISLDGWSTLTVL
jgi:hypothetical protein